MHFARKYSWLKKIIVQIIFFNFFFILLGYQKTNNMKNAVRSLLLLCCAHLVVTTSQLVAQTINIDSLENSLNSSKSDTAYVNTLILLFENLVGKDNKKALRYANEAKDLSSKLKYDSGLARAYRCFGTYYYYNSDYNNAILQFEEGLAIFEKKNTRKEIAFVQNDLSIMHQNIGNDSIALVYSNKSLEIQTELKDTAALASVYTNLAGIYNRNGDFQKTIENIEQVLLLDSLTKDWKYYVEDLGNLAFAYRNLNKHSIALGYAIRGYQFADSIQYERGIYLNSASIGDIYLLLKNFQKAEKYLNISLLSAKKLGLSQLISDSYSRLQLMYYQTNEAEKSIASFDSAYIYASPRSKPTMLNNIGSLYKDKVNNIDSAMVYYKKALASAINTNVPISKCKSLINLSFLHYEKGNFDEAYKLVKSGVKLMDSLNIRETPDVNKKISEVYFEKEKYKKAGYFLKKAFEEQDSLVINLRKSEAKLFNHEQTITENKIQQKELELKLKDQVNANQKIGLLGLGGVSLLLLALWAIYSFQNKKLRNINEKLEQLTEEINHRVKNDFEAVASMIFIQQSQSENEDVKSILSSVKERVSSLGQIHLLLYSEYHYSSLGFSEYLHSLINNRLHSLKSAYKIFEVDLEISVADDLESKPSFGDAKQIGIIVNELITNSFKHAFVDIANPSLKIRTTSKNQGTTKISVIDNGKPFEYTLGLHNSKSFGLNMINLICNRCNWKFSIESTEKGNFFNIDIPKK